MNHTLFMSSFTLRYQLEQKSGWCNNWLNFKFRFHCRMDIHCIWHWILYLSRYYVYMESRKTTYAMTELNLLILIRVGRQDMQSGSSWVQDEAPPFLWPWVLRLVTFNLESSAFNCNNGYFINISHRESTSIFYEFFCQNNFFQLNK